MKIVATIRKFAKLRSSFLLVLVLIQALLIALSSIFTNMAIGIIKKNEDEKVNKIARHVQNEIDRTGERALIAALGAVNNERFVSVFASRDRKQLLDVASGYWQELQRMGFKQFQFHLPPPELTTLLRVHQPEKYGDELSSYRPTVVRCNLSRVTVVGLEQGHSGYGFRAVVPVHYDEKHIGSLEVGLDFGTGFLETMDKTYPGSWGIYNLIRGVNSLNDKVVVASINDADGKYFKNIPPPDRVMASIKIDKMFYEYDRASETIAVYVPVKNFLNDVAVIVKNVYATDYYKRVRGILLASAGICLIGLVLSGLVITVLYKQITIPIKKLVTQTERIKNLELDTEDENHAPLKEIQDLIDATRSMRIGLQSFQKYVPAQLVRQLIQTNQVANIGGRRKNLTIFFSDVADFARISESLTPTELTLQLSDYLNEAAGIIIEEGGTVNQYLGDAIFAFWGAPLNHPDHSGAACRAALRIQSRLAILNKKWSGEGRMPFPTRIGLNTGEIIVGNIGSETRLYYTAVGDAVNLASRLEVLNKHYGTWTLISEFVYERCKSDFAVRMIDTVVVKGRSKPVIIYELVAEKGNISSNELAYLSLFNEAVSLYKKREWDEAFKILLTLKEAKPDDKPTAIYLDRCVEFIRDPPPEDWTGTVIMKEK
jgi:class 3 adenylate cyclase